MSTTNKGDAHTTKNTHHMGHDDRLSIARSYLLPTKSQHGLSNLSKCSFGYINLDGERQRMMLCMLLVFFSIHSVNMNVEIIIPAHVAEKHTTLSQLHISFIFM
jgi:hypothetical protein